MRALFFRVYYYSLFIFKNPEKVEFHPRYNRRIKFGFSIGNRHYYRFAHDYDIFESRFRYLKTFYAEVENKLTSQDINEFSDATQKFLEDYKLSLHAGEPKPELLEQAIELQSEMKYRSEWLFEPTSLYKYASVLYFDLQEDVTDYDVEYNHTKIKYWSKKKELLRMLLKGLMSNVDNLLTLSNEDFLTYLAQLQNAKNRQAELISISGSKDINNKKETEVTI